MSQKRSSSKQAVISDDDAVDFLVVDSRLVIHRGYFDGPFGTKTFTIKVGHEFAGQLVHLIPVPKPGKSCTVKKVTSKRVGQDEVEVIYDIQAEGDLAQLAYTLFVTS
jgi:hypothetical protein